VQSTLLTKHSPYLSLDREGKKPKENGGTGAQKEGELAPKSGGTNAGKLAPSTVAYIPIPSGLSLRQVKNKRRVLLKV